MDCKCASQTVVEEGAVLESIPSDKNKEILSSERRAYCAGSIDLNGHAHKVNLNWIDVLLS